MFGFLKSEKADEPKHWYALVPGFNTSSGDIYAAIERELTERKVPGLECMRVTFSEGGVLSSKREYLRMTRERIVFDICAAPFGTSYFFSCRFAEIPAVIRLWQLVVLFLTGCIVIGLCWHFLGFLSGSLVLFGNLCVVIYLMRNAVAMGLSDLDSMLLQSPVFGSVYQVFFRKETYYRIDTRIMYRDTVDEVVKAKVEEVTGAKGVKLVKFSDRKPELPELGKRTPVEKPSPPENP